MGKARQAATGDVFWPDDRSEEEILAAAQSDPDAQPWDGRGEVISGVDVPEKVARLKRLAAGKRGARPVDVTFSIDADVLEHFQRQGEDWNERINDVLRRAMNDPR